MNPLHDGIDLSDDRSIGFERDRIESVDLSSQKAPASDHHDEHEHKNGYSTIAATQSGGHHEPAMAPSRLPEYLQNMLEHVFKLKKRGTTFEVLDVISEFVIYVVRCMSALSV